MSNTSLAIGPSATRWTDRPVRATVFRSPDLNAFNFDATLPFDTRVEHVQETGKGMTPKVTMYVVYLLISIGLTVWVGRTLSRGGKVFLEDAFGDARLAGSV